MYQWTAELGTSLIDWTVFSFFITRESTAEGSRIDSDPKYFRVELGQMYRILGSEELDRE
jgi:hypothetical protein